MSRTANVTIEYVESHPLGTGLFMLLGEMLKSYPATSGHKLENTEVFETYINNDDEEKSMKGMQINWEDRHGNPYNTAAILVFEADRDNRYREPFFVVRYATSPYSHDKPRTSDVHYTVRNMGTALVEICNVLLNHNVIIPAPNKYPR